MRPLMLSIHEKYHAKGKFSLSSLLRDYFVEEPLDYKCSGHLHAGQVSPACAAGVVRKTSEITSLPKYLFMLVKRFEIRQKKDETDGGIVLESHKIEGELDAPPRLSLGKYCSESFQGSKDFELKAIIRHIGLSGNGHYVCDISRGKEYLRCNDSVVSFEDQKDFEDTGNGYVLVYEKTDQ